MKPDVRKRLIAAAKRVVVDRGLAAEVTQITREAPASTATPAHTRRGIDASPLQVAG